MPPQSTPPAPRATATTTSGGVIPAAAAAPKPVASAPVPTSAPPSKSVPVAVVAPPHHSPDMWLQAWGQYTELAADERSSWAQLCQLEATAQQAIINQVRAFMAKADALLSSEAAGRLYLAQLDDTERLSTIGVPFLMGREMLLVAQHSSGPTTSGPSPDDVLSKLQTELTQLRESAVSERDHRDATDKERVLAWNAQNASMSNTILQLQEHVRSALDAYKTHAFTSASVAAAKAAEQAMERLQESQLAQKSGGTISDDAKRLAKVEFAKMRADARDTALRHTLREERDARDFVEEIQFVVRREFLNLFQAGVLKPLHRVDITSQPMVPPVPQPAAPPPPPPSVQLEAAVTLASISPSRARGPSLGDTLAREATDIQRGRRFVQYFHVLGYDVDIAAVYSSKFVEHGFGFAVDLSVADAEAVLGIHSVCRDVCQEELQAMGIDSIGERRTFFSRVKQFDQQQQQQVDQQHYQEEQPIENEEDGFAVSRTASLPFHVDPYASPTHHHGHLSRHIIGEPAHAPSPSPHRPGYELPPLPTSSASPPRTAGVTVQSIHGYREKCLARLGQLEKQLSDAWTAARHAARKRRTYSHQEEADWESAYGTAQASDAARVSAWIGELSELEVACRTGHSIAPSELPVPFDHKTGSSRSTLLERRILGRPCPRWWLRSGSSAPTSRGPSVPGGIILSTTPAASSAFPAWW
ncbi:Hypothetical protein, putative [Bodo saltans]|uniref:Uncharacterized protein n=1 Tax=Bodo saltans TaxID=75058 RepID=A0A0S4JCR6_BODSA|nr:Hypothetical protein, putative [Bodo saltans]|eukprot:CUG88183.1 Hypothetical protein, putative [Bodo saltans]